MKHLPPGPYAFHTTALPGQPIGNGHVYLVDANGRRIASIWGKGEEKIALVEMIIAASETVKPT